MIEKPLEWRYRGEIERESEEVKEHAARQGGSYYLLRMFNDYIKNMPEDLSLSAAL